MSKGDRGFQYFAPATIEEALSLLSTYKGQAAVMAGGTDILVSLRNRGKVPEYVISLAKVPLDYIDFDRGVLKIGASTRIGSIESSPVVLSKFTALAQAARQLGSPQLRNMGTIGGNVCNATPSADIPPSLLALDARARILCRSGERSISFEDFFVSPLKTVLRDDEILAEIQIPEPPATSASVYLKLPEIRAKDRSATGVAALITLDPQGNRIVDARVSLGAVAPNPIRAINAENILRQAEVGEETIEKAAVAASEAAKPRTRLFYKKELVRILTIQAITQAIVSARL